MAGIVFSDLSTLFRQIYDAYSKILDIMSVAKEEIIIIDGYADKSVLDMIRNTKVKVLLIIKN